MSLMNWVLTLDWVKTVNDLEKIQSELIKQEKKLLSILWSLAKNIVAYLFTLWIYLGIYDALGWERTLIALGVGVILFGIKNNLVRETNGRT